MIKTLAMLAYLFTGTHHHQLPMTLTSPISPKIPVEQLLRGERYAQSSWGHLACDGPCPLQGKHHYVARLYALKVRFYFEKKMAVSKLLKAMKHRIIATATLKMHYKAPTLSPRA